MHTSINTYSLSVCTYIYGNVPLQDAQTRSDSFKTVSIKGQKNYTVIFSPYWSSSVVEQIIALLAPVKVLVNT